MEAEPPASERLPLSVRRLTVRYGERPAVTDLSFSVLPGEIYGLLGSNGAGKSSTIKSIVGLVRPVHGRIRVFGRDVTEVPLATKADLGYVPETSMLYDALTPREFLEFVAGVRGLPPPTATGRAKEYAEAFRLEGEFDEPIVSLSNGTRQKVLIIAALLHAPRLLVLDEPLNGLDPRSVRLVKDLLRQYVAEGGRGVLFSTHTMAIAQELCHRVGILEAGRLRGEGTVEELRRRVAGGDGSLEEIFLRLTREDEGLSDTVAMLGDLGR